MQSTNAPLLHDAALVAELQTRLKVPRSTDVPKAEHVELALRLAREPATDTTKGFWPASIKSSDTRTRIKKLAKRMDEEGHLAAAERAILAQPNGALPPASNFGLGDLYDGLLVPLEWVSENASRLTLLPTQPLTLSPCGKFATRQIIALKDSCCEQVGELVRYDLPPACGEDADAAKLRRDAHRLREKAVIRALDGAAADEYRTKRTQQRRDERSEGYDIAHAVAAVLETLLSAVERKVRRDLWWWRCPAGCPQGATDCARVAFRDKCLELERGRGQLTADHDAEDFLGMVYHFHGIGHQTRSRLCMVMSTWVLVRPRLTNTLSAAMRLDGTRARAEVVRAAATVGISHRSRFDCRCVSSNLATRWARLAHTA